MVRRVWIVSGCDRQDAVAVAADLREPFRLGAAPDVLAAVTPEGGSGEESALWLVLAVNDLSIVRAVRYLASGTHHAIRFAKSR